MGYTASACIGGVGFCIGPLIWLGYTASACIGGYAWFCMGYTVRAESGSRLGARGLGIAYRCQVLYTVATKGQAGLGLYTPPTACQGGGVRGGLCARGWVELFKTKRSILFGGHSFSFDGFNVAGFCALTRSAALPLSPWVVNRFSSKARCCKCLAVSYVGHVIF